MGWITVLVRIMPKHIETCGCKLAVESRTALHLNDWNTKKCKPWLRKMWCVAEITEEYRNRMYRILDLYQEDYKQKYPVVCIDEKSCQLLEEARKPIPLKEGSTAKHDYEYKRNGTGNIFVAIEAKAGKHILSVTERRTKQDFANFIKKIVDEVYPKAKKVRLVVDNLNTHFEKSFYETFTRKEAKRILGRI